MDENGNWQANQDRAQLGEAAKDFPQPVARGLREQNIVLGHNVFGPEGFSEHRHLPRDKPEPMAEDTEDTYPKPVSENWLSGSLHVHMAGQGQGQGGDSGKVPPDRLLGSDEADHMKTTSPLAASSTTPVNARSPCSSSPRLVVGTVTVKGQYDPPDYKTTEFYARYEPREILGEGMSSTVRRALDKQTRKEYAVKIIDVSEGRGDRTVSAQQIREDTFREICLLQLCKNSQQPHIITLVDYFETPAFIFLVFELCRNGELFHLLNEVVSFSEKRTRQYMKQILQVVLFLHSHGIVHRDLKPENILLDEQMNLKVSDFGFATCLSERDTLRDVLGTPCYMAPELLRLVHFAPPSHGYGLPIDLWACGVIMYTLLGGSPPFWHQRPMLMARDIMAGRYSFRSPLWDDVSHLAKDLIRRLLTVDPRQRYTAEQALAHPFFQRDLVPMELKEFHRRLTFKSTALALCFYFRMRIVHALGPALCLQMLKDNPYAAKEIRKHINSAAFCVYSHWVQRGGRQNRAALFQHGVS